MTIRKGITALCAMLAALLLARAPAGAQEVPAAPHIASALVPESDTPAPGRQMLMAITMAPQPGWHGYWKTPGDSGLTTHFTWTLPRGLSAGEPRYPVPGTLMIAGLMNYVYERPYALLVPFTVAADVAAGTRLPIAVKLDYLVCTTSLCVPESASLATAVTVGDGHVEPARAARFDGWRRALPQPLGGDAVFQVSGARMRIAVPLPAAVTLDQPHLFVETDGAVQPGAAQGFTRDGDRLVIDTLAGASAATGFDALLATGRDKGLAFHARPGTVPPSHASGGDDGHGGIAPVLAAFLGAVLGGLILNVMPCVFPILSLKALSLARSGGEERQVRREALAYAAGVVAVCVALGGLILALRAGGVAVGWAFQLQDPRVILLLVALTAGIGFNLAGLFELGTVSAGGSLAARGGIAGAFWTGALAAFVATPCTGPFMAAALGAALVLPIAAALLVFAGLGLGLALPFLAIGYSPALRRRLPKPGGWMETFRRVLAVPMFLTALGLAWVLGRQAGADAVVAGAGAALLLGLGLWLTGIRQRAFLARAWWPALVALVAVIGLAAAVPRRAMAGAQAADAGHVAFDGAGLAALRAAGKPVFLYFTADWCLSCKVNEKVAIDRTETQAAFAKAGVVTMIGDWTDGDATIGRFLEAHGRSGVPLYLWYAPGKAPRELPQVLTPALLVGLAGQP